MMKFRTHYFVWIAMTLLVGACRPGTDDKSKKPSDNEPVLVETPITSQVTVTSPDRLVEVYLAPNTLGAAEGVPTDPPPTFWARIKKLSTNPAEDVSFSDMYELEFGPEDRVVKLEHTAYEVRFFLSQEEYDSFGVPVRIGHAVDATTGFDKLHFSFFDSEDELLRATARDLKQFAVVDKEGVELCSCNEGPGCEEGCAFCDWECQEGVEPLGNECYNASDCSSNERCILGKCFPETCLSSADCPPDYICNSGGNCIPDACDASNPCPTGFICNEDHCAVACTSNTNCGTGEYCDTASGLCMPGCGPSRLECDDGSCEPLYYGCDGYTDCPGGEDETFCGNACTDSSECGAVKCNDGFCGEACGLYSSCPGSLICDAGECIEPDCSGGAGCPSGYTCIEDVCLEQCISDYDCASDHHCDPATSVCVPGCGPNRIDCSVDGVCLSLSQGCNGTENCSDGSDESFCGLPCSDASECGPVGCNGSVCAPPCTSSATCPGELICDAGTCISPDCSGGGSCPLGYSCISDVCAEDCTYNYECGDGAHCDSTTGTCQPGCGPTRLECSDGECIPDYYGCDGYNDCSDGADEDLCGISCVESSECGPLPCDAGVCGRACYSYEWVCDNGQCIDDYDLCDATPDCLDGSDEGVVCETLTPANGSTGYCTTDGFCWDSPIPPTGRDIHGMHGTSSTDIWAVGEGGMLLHYDTRWAAHASGVLGTLRDVYAVSPTSAMAVGDAGQAILWDGTQWTKITTETSASFNAVYGSSSTDYWLGGSNGVLHHFTGGNATVAVTSPVTSTINDLDGLGPADIVGVSTSGGVFQYDGTNWALVDPSSPGTGSYYAIHRLSASELLIAGSGNRVYRYDGTAWTAEPAGTGYEYYYGLTASGSDNIFAVGESGLIARYNGVSWTFIKPDTSVNYRAVYTDGTTNAWAAGTSYSSTAQLLWKWDGLSWKKHSSIPVEDLYDIWAPDALTAVAVGVGGTVISGANGVWAQEDTGITATLNGVWGTDLSNIWAVGNNGAILHSDGSSWSPIPSPVTTSLRGISGTSSGLAIAVGEDGTIIRYDGTNWNPTTEGVSDLNAVHVLDDTHAWAVGSSGRILSWDGSSWTVETSGTTQTLYAVFAFSATDVWAAGTSGTLRHYDGSNWNTVNSQTTDTLRGIWGPTADEVYIVGGTNYYSTSEAAIGRLWNGTEISPIAVGAPALIYSITGAGGTMLGTSVDGLIVRK